MNLAASSLPALAQEDDGFDFSDITKFMKEATAPKKHPPPFAKIKGNWVDYHGLISTVADQPEYKNLNYKWTGQISGKIAEDGQYFFKAKNGCEISGKAIPYASDTMWSIQTKTENCPYDFLNHYMSGRISIENGVMTLRVEDPPLAMGRRVAYLFKTVMKRY